MKRLVQIVAIVVMLFGLTAWRPSGRAPSRQPVNPEDYTMTRWGQIHIPPSDEGGHWRMVR